MLTGKNPPEKLFISKRIDEISKKFQDKNDSELIKDLITRLLETDPTERISAKDALNHPWII